MQQSELSQLHRDVVFGESGGKILWQPRISCWYYDKLAAGKPLPEPYTGMDIPAIHRLLGCSSRLYYVYNQCFQRIEHPSVRFINRQINATDTETTIETPVGKQVQIVRKPPEGIASLYVKREVVDENELKVATWREENSDWQWLQDKFEECQAMFGDLGAPTIYIPRMNIQCLFLEKMGVEATVYAMYDYPDTVKAFFRAREESHERLINLVNISPIEIINFGENVHASTLSPELFEKYHLPACQRRCEKLHSAGKFVSAHWDGNCGPLLKYARETGLDGIEAITPIPQGDVSLEQIKEALGDKMFLIDGIPAILFDDLYSAETLINCTKRVIELFAPRLILGISDEISSTGDIERIRIVKDIVDEYNTSRDKVK